VAEEYFVQNHRRNMGRDNHNLSAQTRFLTGNDLMNAEKTGPLSDILGERAPNIIEI
jgi:hypothetical protein